jgi:hypothetical protein
MAIIIKPPVSGGGGGGAVDSVNGQTGVVVLSTDNIDAGINADRQYFTSALQTDLDAKALQSNLDTLDSRVDTAESDIDSLQANRLYSNSWYVNDGVNDIQAVHDDAAFGEGDVIFVSSGSYGGSTLSLTKSNFSILPPPTGISNICELTEGRGLTISGASCTRVRIRSLQIEGNTLINGTQGRHLFKSVAFQGTTTITNGTSNFITFEDCEFTGAITIASSVTATIYFVRCSFGGVAISSSLVNPLQCLLSDCSGINASQANLVGLAFVGRTGFADNTVSQYTSNAKYIYNLLTGATTTFTGSYSELRDKPTIPSAYTDEQAQDASASLFTSGTHTGISYNYVDGSNKIDSTVSLASFSTDNLAEGSSNKYFSDTLARGAFSAGTGISLSSGVIASTITQYTDADADARINAQKGENNGICELDANGLVPTNHLPPLAITDVHVVADATERLALVAQEGDVAIQTDDSTSWIYDGSAWVQFAIGGSGVSSVNGQTGAVSLLTTDIAEGTNLYYTTTRFDDRLATKTTDNLTEGTTNKYFSDTLARGAFSAGTGITITTGTIASTITQYTDALAKSASVVNSMAGTQTDQAPSVSSVKSYYTAGTGISLSSGTIASTITQYTDEQAQDQAASLFTSGTHTGISYSYIDASNKIDSTVSLAGFSIDALSDVDTTTSVPSNGQALAWSSAGSKWIPTTISSGTSLKPTVTDKTANYTILTPSETVYQEIYTVSGSSAVTITLPDATLCSGVRYDIKRLGTATTTIACNGSQTIDGLTTVQLLAQYVNATVISTGSNWILI